MLDVVVACAPSIDGRLRRLTRRLTRRGMAAADIHRAVGQYAQLLGLARPSYQQVRVLVVEHRTRLAARRATAELLRDVELNTRPAADLLQLLEGMGSPYRHS